MVIGHEESLFKKGYCLGHPSDTYGTEISLSINLFAVDCIEYGVILEITNSASAEPTQ